MKNSAIDTYFATISPLLQAAEDTLQAWKGESNLKFSLLLEMIASQLNLSLKAIKEHDPLIRSYVRHHLDWVIERGQYGGIIPTAEKQKKIALKTAKALAKQQAKEIVEAKIGGMGDE